MATQSLFIDFPPLSDARAAYSDYYPSLHAQHSPYRISKTVAAFPNFATNRETSLEDPRARQYPNCATVPQLQLSAKAWLSPNAYRSAEMAPHFSLASYIDGVLLACHSQSNHENMVANLSGGSTGFESLEAYGTPTSYQAAVVECQAQHQESFHGLPNAVVQSPQPICHPSEHERSPGVILL
ncbi:hypothetical protein BV25DRAFT_1830236 [Artomyces pyxidatus]|uniref:Uncharacterized protein n=1 Tax=Artomyces pyxidatus TaxID=48021 RepID=A0ACB8SQX6_9AGAM|nr:hypothetical protein BV25DRAFT_1830236 [Artomyces pyxidatus]